MHFHKTYPEVTVVDLYQTIQKPGETVEQYLTRFKKIRARCKGSFAEEDVVKIAVAGIRNYEIRKRLSGKNLRDFHVLCSIFQGSELLSGCRREMKRTRN